MGLDGEVVHINLGSNIAVWKLFLTFCEHSVHHGPQLFGLRDGTANLANLTKRFLSLEPGLLVLKLKPDWNGAEGVIPGIIEVFFVEELFGGGTEKL
jgi:hypothetical protein